MNDGFFRTFSTQCDFSLWNCKTTRSKLILSIVMKSSQLLSYCLQNKCHRSSWESSIFYQKSDLLSITENLKQSKVFIFVPLDLKKAFDLVDHNILLNKLFHKLNFLLQTPKLIASYLTSSKCLYRRGNFSEPCEVTSIVPQGDIVPSVLFSLFINVDQRVNDFPSVLNDKTIILYADDTQIFSESPDIVI